jgi:hypothetical protein
MTRLQLDFRKLQEDSRRNREQEFETNRSNVARETETHRHNVESLAETVRNNMRKNYADDKQAEARMIKARADQSRVAYQNARDVAATAKDGTQAVQNFTDWATDLGKTIAALGYA